MATRQNVPRILKVPLKIVHRPSHSAVREPRLELLRLLDLRVVIKVEVVAAHREEFVLGVPADGQNL